MFETNLSELGKVPIIIFDNTSAVINGLYNNTQPINLTITGYVNTFSKLEGQDVYLSLLIYDSILLTIIMFFLLTMLLIKLKRRVP
jgi:hypothetical protein